jgi:hypothetical protein
MKKSKLLNVWHVHNKKFNAENNDKSVHIIRKRSARTHAQTHTISSCKKFNSDDEIT